MIGKPVVLVEVKNVLATSAGSAIFLGNDEKVFVIYVDHSVGSAINMFLHGTPKPRPQTHDLFADVLTSLGAHVDRVVINDFADTVFFARLIIIAENELDERKIVEIDARPSDSIALAVQAGAPIYVAHHVWESVEDMSIVLKKMQDANNEADEGFPGM
ncbi:MAG: bifunctional nuclease family protein [Verrucomicrobiales bacterium]|jgi:bifunctional DNase/RNase|nr:bifunctional nuclease family protein [Verrucomicrobiales bacterium]